MKTSFCYYHHYLAMSRIYRGLYVKSSNRVDLAQSFGYLMMAKRFRNGGSFLAPF